MTNKDIKIHRILQYCCPTHLDHILLTLSNVYSLSKLHKSLVHVSISQSHIHLIMQIRMVVQKGFYKSLPWTGKNENNISAIAYNSVEEKELISLEQ